jgi:hypothetical protein
VLTTIIASANPHQQLLAATVSGNKSNPWGGDDTNESANDKTEPNGRVLIAVATAPQSASPESEYGKDEFSTLRLASALAAPHGRLVGECTRSASITCIESTSKFASPQPRCCLR